MWPFNVRKKTRKVKPEKVVDAIPEKTYAQYKEEYRLLEIENSELEDQCAKDGLSWNEMLMKTKEIKEKMMLADKNMRKIQEPSLTYGKKWKGKKYQLEEFIDACVSRSFVDSDGFGYYATETAKTDILIYPSDIIENIYRTDFPYVLWFNK